MDKYEQMGIVGEGSYGIVMKCRHKETDQVVAIKKFLETEEDATIRKMALREIRLLKRLKHENLVAMIEVFRYRKRLYLVFEYLEGTILDELEKHSGGLGEEACRERIFQITRAVDYCHSNQIIHRDVKPENVLISSLGVIKLCDFGFARLVTLAGEHCTDYVATRWYRAPELLVGETNYGGGVDVWAIGCLFSEIMTGEPLFPGESDIDQLHLIVQMLGNPCEKHQQLMLKQSSLREIIRPDGNSISTFSLQEKFSFWSIYALDFLINCLKMDPAQRSTTEDLLKMPYFTHDRFSQKFLPILREKVNQEFNNNPLLRKYKTEILMSTDKKSDMKPRKLQTEIKWKFNFSDGNTKRHCSEVATDTDKNLITLSKTSQRLNVVQNQKNQTNNRNSQQLSTSMMKTNNKIMSSMIPEYIPKQSKTENNLASYSPRRKLAINNIEFANSKKSSPNIEYNSSKPNMTFNKYTKKLDRNVVIENMFETSNWLETLTTSLHSHKKKELQKQNKNDAFTLPNIHGVGNNASPRCKLSTTFSKEKKNSEFDSTLTVTPDYRYKKAKRKLNVLDLVLPVGVKAWHY